MDKMTRRDFVREAAVGTVVAGAGGLAPCALPADATVPSAPIKLEVLNPIADVVVERVPPAPRLTDLNNKKILLGMQKGNADVAVKRVEELLRQRYTGQQFLALTFPGNIPLTAARIDEIVKWKPDAIFVTNGD